MEDQVAMEPGPLDPMILEQGGNQAEAIITLGATQSILIKLVTLGKNFKMYLLLKQKFREIAQLSEEIFFFCNIKNFVKSEFKRWKPSRSNM